MPRLWAICYDIADRRRLSRVARILEEIGGRIQESVFECRLNGEQLARLRADLQHEIEVAQDSIRFYPLCGACAADVTWQGVACAPGEPTYWIV